MASTQDYGYDANGNLISDPDKRIASISYNQLNLPRQIVFEDNAGKIEFDYDASGKKLRQRVYTGSTLSTTRDYIAGIVFKDGLLELCRMLREG